MTITEATESNETRNYTQNDIGIPFPKRRQTQIENDGQATSPSKINGLL